MWPALRSAVGELSWLLSRGYATPSALKLVGDRYSLTDRQRTAAMRCACSDEARQSRLSRECDVSALAARTVLIDGYNLLTSIEAALSGGVILIARDTCWRDMSSMHGNYHKVQETQPALELAGEEIEQLYAGPCVWYLDAPVSNSGRLAKVMRETASRRNWDWSVEIVPSPDAVLAKSNEMIVTADSVVLDRCGPWVNLARWIIQRRVPLANSVDLR